MPGGPGSPGDFMGFHGSTFFSFVTITGDLLQLTSSVHSVILSRLRMN